MLRKFACKFLAAIFCHPPLLFSQSRFFASFNGGRRRVGTRKTIDRVAEGARRRSSAVGRKMRGAPSPLIKRLWIDRSVDHRRLHVKHA